MPILGWPDYNDLIKKRVGEKVFVETGYRGIKWVRFHQATSQASKTLDNLGIGYYMSNTNIASFRILIPQEIRVRQFIRNLPNLDELLLEADAVSESAVDNIKDPMFREFFVGLRESISKLGDNKSA